jgi:hypothetical protein
VCEVWWSKRQRLDNAPISHKAAGFTAEQFPDTAGSTVQFYVRAVDGLGAVATYPAGPIRAPFAVADGQANFARPQRSHYHDSGERRFHARHCTNVNQTNVMSTRTFLARVVDGPRVLRRRCSTEQSTRALQRHTRQFSPEFPPDDRFRVFTIHAHRPFWRRTHGQQKQEILNGTLLRAGNIPGTHPYAGRAPHAYGAASCPPHEDDSFQPLLKKWRWNDVGIGTDYYPTTATRGPQAPPRPVDLTRTFRSHTRQNSTATTSFKNHRDGRLHAFINFGSLESHGTQLDIESRQIMDVDEWLRVWLGHSFCLWAPAPLATTDSLYARPSDQKMLAFPTDMDFSFNRAPRGVGGDKT